MYISYNHIICDLENKIIFYCIISYHQTTASASFHRSAQFKIPLNAIKQAGIVHPKLGPCWWTIHPNARYKKTPRCGCVFVDLSCKHCMQLRQHKCVQSTQTHTCMCFPRFVLVGKILKKSEIRVKFCKALKR